MTTNTLERPRREIDPLAEAIADVGGLPETATAAVIEPVAKEEHEIVNVSGEFDRATAPRVTSQQVWSEVGRASFAVVSHVTPSGDVRVW